MQFRPSAALFAASAMALVLLAPDAGATQRCADFDGLATGTVLAGQLPGLLFSSDAPGVPYVAAIASTSSPPQGLETDGGPFTNTYIDILDAGTGAPSTTDDVTLHVTQAKNDDPFGQNYGAYGVVSFFGYAADGVTLLANDSSVFEQATDIHLAAPGIAHVRILISSLAFTPSAIIDDLCVSCVDADADSVCDDEDNCPFDPNPSQADSNGNGLGDACEPVCVTIQRGVFGAVEDAHWSAAAPLANFGGSNLMNSGSIGGLTRALIRFDVSSVPPSAAILSASMNLRLAETDAAFTMNAHRVTQPWSEATLTLVNAPAWSSSVEAQAFLPGPFLGGTPTVFSIAALVQAWVSSAATNWGVLLAPAASGSARFSTSEAGSLRRPKLDVCYVLPG